MGRGRKGGGVEIRPKSLRLHFTWNGNRCRETLDMPPTPVNAKYAARLVAEIKLRIETGTFRYTDYFPNSVRATCQPAARYRTVREYGEMWLASRSDLDKKTLYEYGQSLKFWYAQRTVDGNVLMGDRPAHEVGYAELASLVGRIEWTSPKMRNNTLISLRSLFAFAAKDGKFENHAAEIKNAKEEDTIPDPLDEHERELILGCMRDKFHQQVWNFYDLAFFTGARPQEQIALKWIDVNWREDTLYIRRARKADGTDGPLKTYQQRKVRLNARSRAALKRQMQWTYVKKHGYIFENPNTGAPWVRKIGELRKVRHSSRSELGDERQTYFGRAQLAVNVRPRTPYHTRHTFITWAIMNGASVEWVARQVGHKNAKMIYEHYFDWIERAIKAADREVAKLDAAISFEGLNGGHNEGVEG